MFAAFRMSLVYLGLGTVAGVLGVPYSLLIGDIGPLYKVAMWIMRVGLRVAGIDVEVIGAELLPPGESCIFMSNHVSNLDPPVLLPVLPGRSSVLLKKSLTRLPVLGTAMRMAQFVPVERGNKVESAKASIAAAAEALKAGLHIVVYAEGTRSKDGRLAPFKKGPFFLAADTGAPIVPVAISGTQTMMHKGSFAVTAGVARIVFLEPVRPQEFRTREEMMTAVHGAIAAALPPEMRPVAALQAVI